MRIKVTSSRWTQEIGMVCSLKDLREQAKVYTNDRIGKGEIERGPVRIEIGNGKVYDDTDELIGEVINTTEYVCWEDLSESEKNDREFAMTCFIEAYNDVWASLSEELCNIADASFDGWSAQDFWEARTKVREIVTEDLKNLEES